MECAATAQAVAASVAGAAVAGVAEAVALEAAPEGAGAGAAHPRPVVREIPLDLLKGSPRNARKTPRTPYAIEALAGSIAAKSLVHFPTVEPERDETGRETRDYLVSIGEGWRLALGLLAHVKVPQG